MCHVKIELNYSIDVQIEAPYCPVLVSRRRLMRTARMMRAMSPERGVTS